MDRSPQVVVRLPATGVVLLAGVSGSGKSSFARRHFGAYEVLSSDQCRGMICDDEADQSVTPQAFDLLRAIVRLRLAAGRLCVVDATNVKPEARKRTLVVAREFDAPVVAIVLATSPDVAIARNAQRANRVVPEAAVRSQFQDLEASLPLFGTEGYAAVHVLDDAGISGVEVVRTGLDDQ